MYKRTKKRRLLSVLICISLVWFCVLVPNFKAEAGVIVFKYYDWDEVQKELVEKSIPQNNCTVVTSNTTEWIGGEGGSWYIVKDDLTINDRINVQGDVHLILGNEVDFVATYGINVSEDEDNENSLSVYAQTKNVDDMGSLTASPDWTDYVYVTAAIGGNSEKSAGSIIINGGIINIKEENYAGAGIGGGQNGSGGKITINGGVINIEEYGYGGAGIGGGQNGSGGNITINGGTVNTKCGMGAGIGGGRYGDGGCITINNGEINSQVSFYGAGIGGGEKANAGTIVINGGNITSKSYDSAGIGSGRSENANDNSAGGTITINGGIIDARSEEGGAGIGGGYQSRVDRITIKGGEITAIGKLGAGIGSGANKDAGKIIIEGGMINTYAEMGAGIGAGYGARAIDVEISGGNIISSSYRSDIIGNGYTAQEENSDLGKNIRTITLCGVTEQKAITGIVGAKDYGINDVKTVENNKLYLYIAIPDSLFGVVVEDEMYIGKIVDGIEESVFHNCTYTKTQSNTLVATCKTRDCMSYEMAITKPSKTTYTGEPIEAKVTVTPENSLSPIVNYVANTGVLANGKPVFAGNYTASTILGNETISVNYDIEKADSPAKKPNNTMEVTCDKKTVKHVKLLEDWEWADADKDKSIVVGEKISAKAVYVGSDCENYEKVERNIKITAKHTGKTTVKNKKEATYESEGYTGDKCCKGCGKVLTKGKKIPKLEKTDIDVVYRTHIQSYGWQDEVKNGAMSGTEGEAKRLEGIEISVSPAEKGNDAELGIQYTTHCQSYGWLPWSADGDMSGTEREAKRLEAIMIKLTGADAEYYDVYYRVHAQSYGWLGWAKNGAPAGTAGYSKRLEGIQIVVVKKDASFNVKMGGIESVGDEAFEAREGQSPVVNYPATDNINPIVPGEEMPNVAYRTHVQSYGWQGWKYNGRMSGTSGESKRLEGIEIKLTNKDYSGGIAYCTHVQTYGWQGADLNDTSTWKMDGLMAGTSGEAKRLEAICITLTGNMAMHYDVYYRVHAQSYGWLGWAKNGEPSGTSGLSKRLEGIQVILVPKGGAAPAKDYGSVVSNEDKAYIQKGD